MPVIHIQSNKIYKIKLKGKVRIKGEHKSAGDVVDVEGYTFADLLGRGLCELYDEKVEKVNAEVIAKEETSDKSDVSKLGPKKKKAIKDLLSGSESDK